MSSHISASCDNVGEMTDTSKFPVDPPPSHRLLRAARPSVSEDACLSILPLSFGAPILPGQPCWIRARSQVRGLLARRLLVADPQKWRITAFRAGPRIGGGHVREDHPALSDVGPESMAQLPPLCMDGGVELRVVYMGSKTDGEFFRACLHAGGKTGVLCPEVKQASLKSFRTEARPVMPGEQVRLSLPARFNDLYISKLILQVANPSHWLVSDILMGDDTLFVESGTLPGELFSERPGSAPLQLPCLRAGEDFAVQATYVGPCEEASLVYEVSGSEIPGDMEDSAFLPMSSSVKILPSQSLLVSGDVDLPVGYAFLAEDVVLRDPDKWIVNDVKVGNMSLFACSGDAPGEIFGALARECRLSYNKLPSGVPLVIIATYVGSNLAGEPFICGVRGRIVQV